MRKKIGKLNLSRETLRALEGTRALDQAAGGGTAAICSITACGTVCAMCNTAANTCTCG
jgi:hypothetical protein